VLFLLTGLSKARNLSAFRTALADYDVIGRRPNGVVISVGATVIASVELARGDGQRLSVDIADAKERRRVV
jgi:hypothetical protein